MPYPFTPGEVLTSANLNAALDMRMFSTMTGMGIIPGAVVFGHATNGGFQTDNANLFYDDVNNRLGIGSNTPQVQFHVSKVGGAALRSYNSYIDPGNGSWAYLGDWTKVSGVATYGTDMVGAGIATDVSILRGGVEMMRLGVSGLTATVAGMVYTQPIPVMLGSAALAAGVRGCAVMGNYAFTTCQAGTPTETLEVWDINISTAPVKIAGLALAAQGTASPIAAGQYLYVSVNTTPGVNIIDISDPNVPVLVTTGLATVNGVGAMALSGNYLYIGQGSATNNFRIWDVADPTDIESLALITSPGLTGSLSIVLQGKYAFHGGTQTVVGTSGLNIFDVSNPKLPVLVATYNTVSHVRGMAISGKYLYISESVALNGLEILDISDPALPVQVKVFATVSTGPSYVNPIIAGRYLYLGNGGGATSGVQIIDIIDPLNPVSMGSIVTTLPVGGMALSGNRLYLTANSQFRIYNTFGLDAPTIKAGSINTDRLYVDGPTFFAGDLYADRGLSVGPTGIVSRGTVSGPVIDGATLGGVILDHLQSQHVMSGGGTVTWGGPAGRLKWTARFITLPMGRTATSGGYVQFDQPIVNIPAAQVHDGLDRAADATGVVLNNWEALYAAHTPGGTHTAITYYIVIHTVAFIAPSNWTLVAVVNADDDCIKLGTGQILRSGGTITNGVYPYVRLIGAVIETPQVGGIQVMSGLMRNYNVYTDTLNHDWAFVGEFGANIAYYGTGEIGSGLARDVYFVRGNAGMMFFEATGLRTGADVAVTLGGGTRITSAVGGTDGAAFNVDAVASFATAAKFGTSLPVYLLAAQPSIGFNAYWNAAWLFGKGSVAGTNYAGLFGFNTTTGTFAFTATTTTGVANGSISTFQTVAQISNQGVVVIGPGAAFSNAFPALRRTGTALEVVAGDQSVYAPLNAVTATAGTNSIQVATTAYVVTGIANSVANYLPLTGGTLSNGLGFGSAVAASATTLTRHIALYGTSFGFSITSNRINYVVPGAAAHAFYAGATNIIDVNSGGVDVLAGSVQIDAGYLSTVPSPPATPGAQTIYTYGIAVTGATAIMSNCYLDAAYAFRYRTATGATALNADSGAFVFYTAPTGTIGAVPTFTNRFSIGITGIVSVNGVTMLHTDGTTSGYNKVYAGDGTNVALYLGGIGLNTNYYRNTTHIFGGRDQDATPTYLTLAATVATFSTRVVVPTSITCTGTWLYLSSGSGTINASSGPGVYGDANWLITKPGANNLGWIFQTYTGTSRYVFNGDGQTQINTTAGGLFSLLGVTGADIAYQLSAGTSADWKIFLHASTGNLWIYNQKTAALPLYITQTAQTVHQGDVYSVNGSVIASTTVGNASSARLNPGGASNAGYFAMYNSAGTRLGYLGFSNDAPTFHVEAGGKFRVTGAQIANEAGAASGIFFADRTYTTTTHGWYADAYSSYLWYSATGNGLQYNFSTITFTVTGACAVTGTVSGNAGTFSTTLHATTSINTAQFNLRSAAFALQDASNIYNQIFDPSNAGYIAMYASGTNYHDQTSHQFRSRAGGVYCYFDASGTWNQNGGSWGDIPSDGRMKENIQPYQRGLSAIVALEPISYTYKEGTPLVKGDQEVRYGFTAQNVEAAIPEMVADIEIPIGGELKEVIKGIKPGWYLFCALINSVKELKERIELLEMKVGEA